MKRHFLTFLGGLAAIGLTVLILMGGHTTIQGRESTATPDFTLETPDDIPAAADDEDALPEPGDPVPAIAGQEENKPVRGIEPESFGLPETVTTEPLTRIEARAPLSEPVAKAEPELQVLRHPTALSAGTIQFENGTLQLDGIEPQSAERQCGEGGKTWPCGMVARTAFRAYLRARALRCMVPADTWQGTITARCSLGDTDPAQWLADNGWAEASANSPLGASVAAARAHKLGFYGDGPQGAAPQP